MTEAARDERKGGVAGRPLPLGEKLAIALAAATLNGLIYLGPNRFPLLPGRMLPLTAVDRRVAFIPSTLWLYISDYLLLFCAFLTLKERAKALRFVEAYSTLNVLSGLIHWLWPTAFPRHLYPLGRDVDEVTRAVFAAYRAVDTSRSCLPSMHVAGSFLAAFALRREGPRKFVPALVWAALVAGSTLTTKQHYLVDVGAGLGMALLVSRMYYSRRGAEDARVLASLLGIPRAEERAVSAAVTSPGSGYPEP